MRTLGAMLVATILWAWSAPSVAAAEKTAVEWQVSTGQTYSASNGRMGDTDVLVELPPIVLLTVPFPYVAVPNEFETVATPLFSSCTPN